MLWHPYVVIVYIHCYGINCSPIYQQTFSDIRTTQTVFIWPAKNSLTMAKKRSRSSTERKKVETDRSKSDGESDEDRPAPVRYSEDEPEAKKVRYKNRT